MNRLIAILLLTFTLATNSHAAVWVKLQENNESKLMLDKQSVLETNKLKRAWIKVVYKSAQTNPEVAEKTYNLSKLLWFFDCTSQKAATSQVFQFSDDELIYSAAVDSKDAKFIEPVPETDIDVAMRYVCGVSPQLDAVAEKPVSTQPNSKTTEKTAAKLEQNTEQKPEAKPVVKETPKPELSKAKVTAALVAAGEKSDKVTVKPIVFSKSNVAEKSGKTDKLRWGYEGAEGPEGWAKISPEFATCETGRNQSPINIDATLHAELKPLKSFQKFPASDIVNNGHTIQVNFKPGNILALDSVLFQLKHVNFHVPSENTVHGKSFPLEADFMHYDTKGNLSVLAVMFEEGKANDALGRLWQQMPTTLDAPVLLKGRVTPTDLIPHDIGYYRFSGSLTTPPCTEGVRWVVLKSSMTASAAQIEALKKVLKHENNRPVQELNGRLVVE